MRNSNDSVNTTVKMEQPDGARSMDDLNAPRSDTFSQSARVSLERSQ